MKYQMPNLENLEFTENNFFYKAIRSLFGDKLAMLMLPAPIRKRKKVFGKGDVTLDDMSQAFCFTDDKTISRLINFEKQRIRKFILSLVVLFFVMTVFVFLTEHIVNFLVYFYSIEKSFFGIVIDIFLFFYWLYFFYIFWHKLNSILVDGFFAEYLCVNTLFYILFTLSKEDAIFLQDTKQYIQVLINYLVKNINSFASSMKRISGANEKWIDEYFSKINSYILAKEHFVVAPNDLDLEKLRQDFFIITNIFVTGNYGDFNMFFTKDSINVQVQPKEKAQYKIKKASRYLLYILPLITLFVYIFFPEISNRPDSGLNSLLVLFFTWLLVTIDELLGSASVDRFLKLLKVLN